MDKSKNVIRRRIPDRLQQILDCLPNGSSPFLGRTTKPLNFFELINRRGGRTTNLLQRFGEVPGIFLPQPKVGIDDVAGFFRQIQIEIAIVVILAEKCQNFTTLSHSANQFRVADLKEIRLVIRSLAGCRFIGKI